MRFIHIADVHLGAVPDKGYPWSKKRADEIWETFQRILEETKRQQADLLLIAGDLFHRPPLLRELKEVNYLFQRLERTQVVWIAGNHDFLQPACASADFEWADNVIFLNGKECESVYFRNLQTTVYGFSYYSREITAPLYDDLAAEDTAGCQILLAHGGDERHIPINFRRLAEAGFDYIALGHIHKPQILAENKMAYAGALEPIDCNDTGEHGYILGEYRNGKLHTKFVPFACRKYIHLTLKSQSGMTDYEMRDRLLQAVREYGVENIYRAQLTGFRDAQTTYRTEDYVRMGNILEVTDRTEPDYDFEELRILHRHDIIGHYIERLLPDEEDGHGSDVKTKALYYGVQALTKRR